MWNIFRSVLWKWKLSSGIWRWGGDGSVEHAQTRKPSTHQGKSSIDALALLMRLRHPAPSRWEQSPGGNAGQQQSTATGRSFGGFWKVIISPINSEIVLLTFTKLIWKIYSHTKVNRGDVCNRFIHYHQKSKAIKMPCTGWRRKLQHIH